MRSKVFETPQTETSFHEVCSEKPSRDRTRRLIIGPPNHYTDRAVHACDHPVGSPCLNLEGVRDFRVGEAVLFDGRRDVAGFVHFSQHPIGRGLFMRYLIINGNPFRQSDRELRSGGRSS